MLSSVELEFYHTVLYVSVFYNGSAPFFRGRDMYYNVTLLSCMLVSIRLFICESVNMYLVAYIYFLISLICLRAALFEKEHMIFVHLGPTYFTKPDEQQNSWDHFNHFVANDRISFFL